MRVLLTGVAVSLAAPALLLTPQPVSAARSGTGGECTMVSGGFEEPDGLRGQEHLREDVPGWRTSSSDGLIEIWGRDNRAAPMDFTVAPDTGDQFAELNGTSVATLHQDIRTLPGSTLDWSLAHRGRTGSPDSKDVMRVRIGGVVQTPAGQDSPDIADGNGGWGHYSGSYTVPRGQWTTRMEFVSVSSGTGRPDYGNLLDSVSISCASSLAVRNQPPSMPYLVLSGPVRHSIGGSLDSEDPEGDEVTYSAGTPEPRLEVTVGPDGTVTARAGRPILYQVPVRACDGQGACSRGRIVIVAYHRAKPSAGARPAGPRVKPAARASSRRPGVRPEGPGREGLAEGRPGGRGRVSASG
ncbi:hypothetical protein [Streptosporangium sp. NPDC003464]